MTSQQQPAALVTAGQSSILALEKHLKARAQRIQEAVPAMLARVLTPERMIALAMSSASRNPQLLECTPESFFVSLHQLAQVGLEPGTALGHAYLVPYNNKKTGKKEAQAQIGYRGFITIASDCGAVKTVYGACVYAREIAEGRFKLRRGTDPRIDHDPLLDPNEKDVVAGAYAVATLPSGEKDFEWMSTAEIESIRARSKAGDYGPWVTDWIQMALKTVLRRLLKRQALNVSQAHTVRMEKAFEADNATFDVSASSRDVDEKPIVAKGAAGLVDALGGGTAEDTAQPVDAQQAAPDEALPSLTSMPDFAVSKELAGRLEAAKSDPTVKAAVGLLYGSAGRPEKQKATEKRTELLVLRRVEAFVKSVGADLVLQTLEQMGDGVSAVEGLADRILKAHEGFDQN